MKPGNYYCLYRIKFLVFLVPTSLCLTTTHSMSSSQETSKLCNVIISTGGWFAELHNKKKTILVFLRKVSLSTSYVVRITSSCLPSFGNQTSYDEWIIESIQEPRMRYFNLDFSIYSRFVCDCTRVCLVQMCLPWYLYVC